MPSGFTHLRAIFLWPNRSWRRHWVGPLLLLMLVPLLIPVDAALHQRLRHWAVPANDVRVTLETIERYGDVILTLGVAWVIWLLDRQKRARLLDLATAWLATGGVCLLLKVIIHRPRPVIDTPWVITGWGLAAAHGSSYYAMPSSHTAIATALSVVLARLYPRLMPLAVTMPILVGAIRIILQAHYPSDVAAGALVGYSISQLVMTYRVGSWWLGSEPAISPPAA